ncbi:MAG: General stress protein 69 [Alphaproteobacteria bacterium MarineAlpha9_Bin7]|nr:MAG: General stress protein 69 [Alphaproteobacteria bacterium MarineAlpha9_Bin7]
MEYQKLGASCLNVSPICFGGNVFGWTATEKDSFRILDAFLDAGFNFIDTADVYSRWADGNEGGESEIILGKWLKSRGRRGEIVLATKFGMDMGSDKVGLSPEYMATAVEASLRRLQTDYIDLYQSHKDDDGTPVAATLEAYAKLIEQGKVREIGASNFATNRLKEALDASAKEGLPRYQSLQPLYSLVERREYEGEMEDLCSEENIGVISYFSLASGFLTGKYRSSSDVHGRARGPAVQKYMNEDGFRVVEALDEVAEKHSAKLGQVALAWLMARPSVTAPIASATNLDQLEELVSAADLILDPQDINKINEASSP